MKLLPRDFWRLSPAELACLLGRGNEVAPLTMDRLQELARAYPDMVKGTKDDTGDRSARPDHGA